MHREGDDTAVVVLRAKPTDPPAFKRNEDPSPCPQPLFAPRSWGRLISGVALHCLEHRCRCAGCFVILAPLTAPHFDNLLL